MPAMSNLNATHISPVVQPVDEATTQTVLGGSITVRLRAEQTDGRLGLVEQVIPGGYPDLRCTCTPSSTRRST